MRRGRHPRGGEWREEALARGAGATAAAHGGQGVTRQSVQEGAQLAAKRQVSRFVRSGGRGSVGERAVFADFVRSGRGISRGLRLPWPDLVSI